MAADPFNSIAGYTAGIPPVTVIDSNGNVVSNFLNLSGNVSANKVYANSFFYANGQPFAVTPGGSNTQLQFNNNGVLGGIPNATWNGNILNLGDVATLSIGGGINGYYLQTDGTGNLTWAAGGGGGNGVPGGANTQVQFNDAGDFGGDAGFTYNKVTNTLQVENISAGDTLNDTVNITGNLSINGNIILSTDFVANGNVSGDYLIGNGYYITGISSVNTANFVIDPIQSNITSLGNLTSLNIVGNTNSTGNISTSGNVLAGNISVTSLISTSNVNVTNKLTVGSNLTVNASATLRVLGNINTNGSPNINLGTLSNIHIDGGFNGYFLQTDGAGNLTWAASGGGGNGSPGGTNTQVQYNKAGLFGGSSFFTFNDTTNVVQVAGSLVANSVQMGSGIYNWSNSFVYFATTASTASGQVLYSIPVSEISGVEFEIIATDPTGPSRQFCKISSVYYAGTIQYNEYASLFVNGGVGSFDVDFNAGNLVYPPSLELKVTPSVATSTSYKMLITTYAS